MTGRRASAGRDLLPPLLAAPLLAWLFESTALDRVLIAPFYDPAGRVFPLRDDVVMQNILHGGMKLVVVAIAFAAFGAFLLSFVLPQWERHRRRLLWTTAGMAGASLVVALLKHGSALHCPWDMAEYGGYAPLHGLFDGLPAGIAAGRCFPGGHASGGFALMAFYFAWRDKHARAARAALVAALAAGMLMGWSQMMRGAHFMSHNLWSAWVVWMFLAVLCQVIPPSGPVSVQPRKRASRFTPSSSRSSELAKHQRT